MKGKDGKQHVIKYQRGESWLLKDEKKKLCSKIICFFNKNQLKNLFDKVFPAQPLEGFSCHD